MKRKNNFDLTSSIAMQERKWVASVNILEPLKEITFHVYDTKAIMVEKKIICIASLRGRDLERFAVNILKALNSKKLKQ